MLYICHRGNRNGPNPERENESSYIQEALDEGFDVEIDVWVLYNGKYNVWYLGHDKPTYEIKDSFLIQNKDRLWCHAKNFRALEAMMQFNDTVGKIVFNCFWHQNDDYTCTSAGYIWTYPDVKNELGPSSIAVMPELILGAWGIWEIGKAFGICSDFVSKYKERLNNK